ncbi:MAG: hypothetical protein VB027_02375 [Gordonibacter sp.]|nr:hypothetical protein [Gordonibacter sp.]
MILVPFFSAYHAPFLEAALSGSSEAWRVVTCLDEAAVCAGLETVNNDACFASLLAAGRTVVEVRSSFSSEVDALSCIVVPMPCVSCRGDDTPYLIARALEVAGFSFPAKGVVDGLALLSHTKDYLRLGRIADALVVGDALLQISLRVRPYLDESRLSSFNALLETWSARACEELAFVRAFDVRAYLEGLDGAIESFGVPERDGRPVVGIIGSAPALFDAGMNSDMIACIECENCEVAVPYLVSLASFALRTKKAPGAVTALFDGRINILRNRTNMCWRCPSPTEVERAGLKILPAHRTQGPGLTMAGYARLFVEWGIRDFVYVRTFGCLAGHVVGQGAVKRLRTFGDCTGLPVNIATIEFDPGTSDVNQVNRIKLMASVAKRTAAGSLIFACNGITDDRSSLPAGGSFGCRGGTP